MKRVAIIYDTRFGNTEKVARALAEGIMSQGIDTDSFKTDEVEVAKLDNYDLISVGGPTHIFGASGPMKEFLRELEKANIREKRAFTFDTKFNSRFAGTAGKKIENKLKELGMRIVKPSVSAIVKGGEGPLEDKTEEKFIQLGVELAKAVQ